MELVKKGEYALQKNDGERLLKNIFSIFGRSVKCTLPGGDFALEQENGAYVTIDMFDAIYASLQSTTQPTINLNKQTDELLTKIKAKYKSIFIGGTDHLEILNFRYYRTLTNEEKRFPPSRFPREDAEFMIIRVLKYSIDILPEIFRLQVRKVLSDFNIKE